MQQAEKALEELVAEPPAHQFVPAVPRPKPIAMSEAECLSAYLHDIGLLKDPDSEFLEIMKAPDVMVALKETHLHPGVHQIQQGGEHPDIALRDHIVVLVPKVPDVPEHVERLGPVLRDGLQETDESGLPLGGIIDVQPKMHVGDKVRKGPVSHCYS